MMYEDGFRMRLKPFLTSVLLPPVGACRYGCGTNCAAPVTVFWLFGLMRNPSSYIILMVSFVY